MKWIKKLVFILVLALIYWIGSGLLTGQGLFARKSATQEAAAMLGNLPTASTNPFLFPCRAHEEESSVSFTGTVKINTLFSDPAPEQVLAAIQEQLKFVDGWLSTNEKPEGGGAQKVFLSSRPADIQLVSQEKTTYGLQMSIDAAPGSEPHQYVRRAIQRGFTHLDDPALTITYQAKIYFSSCTEKPLAKLFTEISLPFDPYLAYWLVAPEARRKIHYQGSTTLTNPCANPEIASIPFTKFYWFMWGPQKNGIDFEQKSFDCRKILIPGQHYARFSLHLENLALQPKFQLGDALRSVQGPLKAHIFFSLLQPWSVPFDAEKLMPLLQSSSFTDPLGEITGKIEFFLKSIDESKNGKKVVIDYATYGFLFLLKNLPQIFQVSKVTTEISASHGHLEMHMLGKLKASGRPIELTLYHGNADASGEQIPEHWPSLLTSLEEDDILMYVGHAGMGTNMSLQKMSEALHLSQASLLQRLARKPYQLVNILSCNAFTYFGQDISRLRQQAAALNQTSGAGVTDLLLAQPPDFQFNPLFFIGVFEYLDQLLNESSTAPGTSVELTKVLMSRLNFNDSYWISRQGLAL